MVIVELVRKKKGKKIKKEEKFAMVYLDSSYKREDFSYILGSQTAK